jgi:hypothetical protein
MTANELNDIIQSKEIYSLNEIKEILWQVKNDCVAECAEYAEKKESMYYTGEITAFYICLDLLDRLLSEDEIIERVAKVIENKCIEAGVYPAIIRRILHGVNFEMLKEDEL